MKSKAFILSNGKVTEKVQEWKENPIQVPLKPTKYAPKEPKHSLELEHDFAVKHRGGKSGRPKIE